MLHHSLVLGFSCLLFQAGQSHAQNSISSFKIASTSAVDKNSLKSSELVPEEVGISNKINSNMPSIASTFEDEEEYKGKFKYASSRGKSYFFGASSIGITKGDGYYQNVLLSTNMVNYGISDNFSIGGGLDLISLIFGPMYYFTPRLAFQHSEYIHIGAGISAAGIFGEGLFGGSGSEDIFSLGYAQVTIGTEDLNLSIGGGPLVWRMIKNPTIMPTGILSGFFRLSSGLALVAESYFIQMENESTNKLVTRVNGIYGISILSRKFSFDIGLGSISGESYGGNSAVPYLSYVKLF